MPKLNPKTEKQRAQALLKPLLDNNLNQAATARQLGVSQATINEKVHKKSFQDVLTKFLNSKKLKKALIEVGVDGLKAVKPIGASILVDRDGQVLKAEDHGGIEVPDYAARHKYWHDMMIASGGIKLDKHEAGVSIVNIVYAYRAKPKNSPLRSE